PEIRRRPDRHDAGGIDGLVALVIVVLDVVHVHGAGNAGKLEQLTRECPYVGVVDDAATVAFEVAVIDLVETHQRGEEPDVGFGQPLAHQVALLPKPRFQPVQRVEHGGHGFVVGGLAGGKAGLVYAVVDVVVHARVHRVDFRTQRL